MRVVCWIEFVGTNKFSSGMCENWTNWKKCWKCSRICGTRERRCDEAVLFKANVLHIDMKREFKRVLGCRNNFRFRERERERETVKLIHFENSRILRSGISAEEGASLADLVELCYRNLNSFLFPTWSLKAILLLPRIYFHKRFVFLKRFWNNGRTKIRARWIYMRGNAWGWTRQSTLPRLESYREMVSR